MIKSLFIIVAILLLQTFPVSGQVEYVDDESCGCELVFINGIQTTQDGDLFGFKLADGTVICENKYKFVDKFHDNYCKVYLGEGQCGMIDRTGAEIVPCRYDDIMYPSNGRILVIKNTLIGYCDMKGNEIIPLQYRQASSFKENTAVVVVMKTATTVGCTFIDTTGLRLFDIIYDNARPFNEGYAPVCINGAWGLINSTGQVVFPVEYEAMSENHDSTFFAGSMNGMALYDYNMRPLTKAIYQPTGNVSENRIAVIRDGLYGFLDRKGNEIVECRYDEIGVFKQGRTLARIGKKYGIIDTLDNIILPIEYDHEVMKGIGYMYNDSLAMVEKNGKIGYVDLDGKFVISPTFQSGFPFSQGFAAVKFNNRWGYINTKGDVYMPFVFDYASPYKWGRADVVFNGTASKVNLKGKCVKNCNGVIAWRNWKE